MALLFFFLFSVLSKQLNKHLFSLFFFLDDWFKLVVVSFCYKIKWDIYGSVINQLENKTKNHPPLNVVYRKKSRHLNFKWYRWTNNIKKPSFNFFLFFFARLSKIAIKFAIRHNTTTTTKEKLNEHKIEAENVLNLH